MLKKSIVSLFISSALISGCGSDNDTTETEIPNSSPILAAEFEPVVEKSLSVLSVVASDTDGSISSYEWEQIGGPAIDITGQDSKQISFTAPSVTLDTPISFKVSVTDNDGATTTITADTEIERIENIYRLVGRVVGEQHVSAKVAATVADESAEGFVDDAGNFSVDLAVDDDVELNSSVKLSAATESSLELVSLQPSLAQLSGLIADTQASLSNQRAVSLTTQTLSNAPVISISAVTTALYSLLVEANSGVEPANIETFELVEGRVNPDALIETAAVVKILLDSEEPLLEDDVDLVTVLADPEQYNHLVKTIEDKQPGSVEKAIVAVVNDPNLTPPLTASEVPDFYYQTSPVAASFVARNGSRYEFEQDYTGTMSTGSGVSSFTWKLENGDILLKHESGQGNISYVDVNSIDGLSQNQKEAILAAGIYGAELTYNKFTERMSRLTVGAALDSYRFETINKVTMTPIDVGTEVISIPAWETTDLLDTLMRKSATGGVDFVAENLTGLWGLEVYNDSNDLANFDKNHFEVIEFLANGKGSSKDTGATFSWNVDEGILKLTFADFIQTYEIIDSGDGDLSIYSEVFDHNDKQLLSLFGYATELDASTSFTAETAVTGAKQYWQTMINQWTTDSWSGDKLNFCYSGGIDCDSSDSVFFGFQAKLDNSGTLFNQFEGTPPNLVNFKGTELLWSITESGNLKYDYTYDTCLDSSEYCRNRQWRLLKVVDGRLGQRIYVQEFYQYRELSTDSWQYMITPRWNMYELIDLEYFNNVNKISKSQNVKDVQRVIFEPNLEKTLKK
ncbi:PKD domain-containing protein [Shewanella halifaxensis]|uniref:PKD domain-containing protein n=1 Tax=Shewanella halifaxensis TaxID=271098 RepID=UPI000D59ED5E|nr:hypothetical protein [Shewanella halifaxensis]